MEHTANPDFLAHSSPRAPIHRWIATRLRQAPDRGACGRRIGKSRIQYRYRPIHRKENDRVTESAKRSPPSPNHKQTTSVIVPGTHGPQLPQWTRLPRRVPTERKLRCEKSVPRHRTGTAARVETRISALPLQESCQWRPLPPEIQSHAGVRHARSCSTTPVRHQHRLGRGTHSFRFFGSAAASSDPAPNARSPVGPSQKTLQ